jgi:hypothetical protein
MFAAAANDPVFLELGQKLLDIVREHSKGFYGPITAAGMMRIKIAIMRFMIDQKSDLLGDRLLLEMNIGQMQEILDNLPALMREQGFTNEDLLPADGELFNDAAKALHTRGKLSYDKLLVTSPGSYLRFG